MLHVHGWTPTGFVHAGVLRLEENGDRDVRARFRYTSEWAQNEHAYPLDPINMASYQVRYDTDYSHVTLGAIFDANIMLWSQVLIVTAAFAGQRIRMGGGAVRWLNRAIGAMFISFGLKLALTRS